MRRLGSLSLLLVVTTVICILGRGPVSTDAEAQPPHRTTELRVLGYNSWVAGGPASVRIISYDPSNGAAVAAVPVEATLVLPNQKAIVLARGTTNSQGTLEVEFKIPAGLEGSGVLHVKSKQVAGADLEAPISIRQSERIFLSTDKPLYQPGQEVNVRILALHEPELTPLENQPVTVEIEDAKGNKVFKKKLATSKFGVVGTSFELAHEVNMGEYHVKAFLNQGVAEKSFTVKRYVLPKFKVLVKTDKSWYMPAAHVHGTVQADYFFGKPVGHARVSLAVKTFDVSEHDLSVIEGTTDENGSYSFDFELPNYFAGRPLDKGGAPLALAAEVTDNASHKEMGPLALTVVSQPIQAEIFPESGTLQPGLDNQVYVVTSYPDGKPAACDVTVTLPQGESRHLKTDATGFGQFSYNPRALAYQPGPMIAQRRGWMPPTAQVPTVSLTAQIVAHDAQGNEATDSVVLPEVQAKESVLIRPDKALYRVGDRLTAQILSTRKTGSVYVDFVRSGQTILTRSVDLTAGHATLSMDLAADTYGAITLHAYQIAASQDIIRDSRPIFVQPARDLTVQVKLDRSTYQPGHDARIDFLVQDKKGSPRLAVLGVDIVDESLFSLAEKEPGLERVYFLLEREMMQPRYEVHGFSLTDAVKDPENVEDGSRQNLSRAVFSKLPAAGDFTMKADSYTARLQQVYQDLVQVQNALYMYHQRHGSFPGHVDDLVSEGFIAANKLIDPWGHRIRYKMVSGTAIPYSVGPDGRDGTADDIGMDTFYNRYGMDMERDGLALPMGGMGGARRAEVPMDMARPMALPAPAQPMAANKAAAQTESRVAYNGPAKDDKAASPAPARIREFFPETLYTNPQVITDDDGRASITVPMADSITTWRLGAFASSRTGEMGQGDAALRVFQDFFVDIDLPVSLSQGDEVSVPVAVYNYLPETQEVTLSLDKGDWFELQDEPVKTLSLRKNEVSVVYYRIRAQKPGTHPLTVQAHGTKLADAVRRSVDVVPNGQAFETVLSDRLAGNVSRKLTIPKDAVAGASKLLVTIYPGIFSQVVEGLDSIFQMPNGCFEQTSSTTFPNVLVLDYLKRTRKITPEIQMKAEGFINTGYQRLLTFEVKGGGFSVFGQVPANPILTAYGLMEFSDMSKVHEVDPNLIGRTRAWLLAQQQPDGSWLAGREGFYAEGWSNVPNSNLVSTAYITWALLETGEKGPGIAKAVGYLKDHLQQVEDAYTAALVANAMVLGAPQDALTQKALSILMSMKNEDKDVVYWRTKIATAAFGTGTAGDIETTALATLALMGSDHYATDVNKAITYLVKSKDGAGTWHSTQATVLAMKALVRSVDKASEQADATVQLKVNGKAAGTIKITPADYDVFRQVDVSNLAQDGENDVELELAGKGNCLYKVVGRYWRPWEAMPVRHPEALGIDVIYDRTHLATDDTATCTVKVQNLTKRTANMVVIDVGIPPGFDVRSSDLETLVQKRAIEKFSNTGRQLILYLEKIDPARTLTLSYHLKAKFPVRVQTPPSRAYEYYNPKREAMSRPIKLEVTRR